MRVKREITIAETSRKTLRVTGHKDCVIEFKKDMTPYLLLGDIVADIADAEYRRMLRGLEDFIPSKRGTYKVEFIHSGVKGFVTVTKKTKMVTWGGSTIHYTTAKGGLRDTVTLELSKAGHL